MVLKFTQHLFVLHLIALEPILSQVCISFFAALCHVPSIDAATSAPYRLLLQVTHLDIENTGILFAYKIIYRQLGSPSWNVKISRRSLFSSRINLVVSFLKPYRNYTFRVFPYSLLGDRLGSKLKMFQTAEKGEPGVSQILLYSRKVHPLSMDLWEYLEFYPLFTDLLRIQSSFTGLRLLPFLKLSSI